MISILRFEGLLIATFIVVAIPVCLILKSIGSWDDKIMTMIGILYLILYIFHLINVLLFQVIPILFKKWKK